MKKEFKSVDEYLGSLEPNAKHVLGYLRKAILKASPKLVESIRYNMPYYDASGMVCAFAAQKNYYAFYILSHEARKQNAELIKDLDMGKGVVRFNEVGTLPESLIKTIVISAVKANEKGLEQC